MAKSETAASVFSKDQLMASTKYVKRQDLLAAILEDGKNYTTDKVDSLIENFMKGKVI